MLTWLNRRRLVCRKCTAEAAKDGLPLEYYTIDYGSELSAFSPALLRRQAEYARFCAELLLPSSSNGSTPAAASAATAGPRARSLLAVGHSMGGVVLQLATQLWRGSGGPSAGPGWMLLAALGTPHYGPVIATEAGLWRLYRQLRAATSGPPPPPPPLESDGRAAAPPVLLFSGGSRDRTVPSHLTTGGGGGGAAAAWSRSPQGPVVEIPAAAVG